jgi:hypothetical protein
VCWPRSLLAKDSSPGIVFFGGPWLYSLGVGLGLWMLTTSSKYAGRGVYGYLSDLAYFGASAHHLMRGKLSVALAKLYLCGAGVVLASGFCGWMANNMSNEAFVWITIFVAFGYYLPAILLTLAVGSLRMKQGRETAFEERIFKWLRDHSLALAPQASSDNAAKARIRALFLQYRNEPGKSDHQALIQALAGVYKL